MGAYRNFDATLAEKRAKEKPDEPIPALVAFTVAGEDFLVTQLPGTVFFRAATLVASDGRKYDTTTPQGRAAMEKDGTAILLGLAGVFRDMLGEDQYGRVIDAMGRASLDVVEVYELAEWVMQEAIEAATARPTSQPSDSAPSSSPNGTPGPRLQSVNDSDSAVTFS